MKLTVCVCKGSCITWVIFFGMRNFDLFSASSNYHILVTKNAIIANEPIFITFGNISNRLKKTVFENLFSKKSYKNLKICRTENKISPTKKSNRSYARPLTKGEKQG